ncbi:MAG: type II/IV secretion system protein [Acidobacteria bacterium]|nr:type II/IV secretion system protein [Acidobacteriota bacterium]
MSGVSVSVGRAAGATLQKVLEEKGLVTAEELQRARRVWDRLEQKGPFGAHLVALGLVTREQLEAAQSAIRESLSPAEILVEMGRLTPEALARADAAAHRAGAPVESELVASGATTEESLLEARAAKHGLEVIALEPEMIDLGPYRRVPASTWRRLQVLPIALPSGSCGLAMPRVDADAILEIRDAVGRNPVTRLCSATAMSATLKALETPPRPPAGAPPAVEAPRDGSTAEIVDRLIRTARRERASDIHIEPGETKSRVRLRIDGRLVPIAELGAEQGRAVTERLKILAGCDFTDRTRHQCGRFSVGVDNESVDVTVSTFVSGHGEDLVLRILARKVGLVGLERLGLSPIMLRELVDQGLSSPEGLFLVTGPRGSGRTTTLFNAIDYCNDVSLKIISAEDPAEFSLQGMIQWSRRPAGGPTVAESIRASLNQDPDVVVIGEILDAETAALAVEAALRGHRVFATFRTESAAGAVVRLLDMGMEPFLVGSTARAVLAQRLVRRICPECAEEASPPASELRLLGISPRDAAAYPLRQGRGCPGCHMTGYRGRMGVFELVVVGDALRDAILERAPLREIERLCLDVPGYLTLTEDAVIKALQGLTTLSEVIHRTPRAHIRPARQLMERAS